MVGLVVAGFLAGISPCILPVLLVAGASQPASGGMPARMPWAASGRLLLHASPGVQAYDFTFG